MGAILKQETTKYEGMLYEHRSLVQDKFKELRKKKNISVEDEKVFENLTKI